jgi:protein-tyrosine phosphatase/arsenate reductase
MMIISIKTYCDNLTKEFDLIPKERKELLEQITHYIISKQNQNKPINLIYICTHNSRRSHFGQIWAQVAAHYYNIKNVHAFSGGTDATAFNINAINALKRIGFMVKKINEDVDALYHIYFDETLLPIACFSKVYTHVINPGNEFAAIMTCSDAEENCPFIPGVELRIGTPYDDPKAYDNTPLQDTKYDERCKQIALETLYAFSKTK